MRRQPHSRQQQRGMTLIEVLVSLLLMTFITVSILQLFALATAINLGSAARTDLTYRCQRVAETIRLVEALRHLTPTPTTLTEFAAIDLPHQVNTTYYLPTDLSDAAWGRAGANVVDGDGRFQLAYSVEDGVSSWIVTVTAMPKASGQGGALCCPDPKVSVRPVSR
jgi:prepilin-type N-terminal cleavage/methylation domain-containing protein